MPRRRRGAGRMAVELDTGRGLVTRILLHSPKDMVAGALAFAAVSAIVANALFLQAGRHPAPMFGSTVAMPPMPLAAGPLPRPRPMEADASSLAPMLVAPKVTEAKSAEPRTAEARTSRGQGGDPESAAPNAADPMANLVRATTGALPPPHGGIVRPPAAVPVVPVRNDPTAGGPGQGSRRVAAVQRALTEYGYAQLKPSGTLGTDTQAAIQKFERDRKLPVTGQMSDRLVRELSAMIGRPIE